MGREAEKVLENGKSRKKNNVKNREKREEL